MSTANPSKGLTTGAEPRGLTGPRRALGSWGPLGLFVVVVMAAFAGFFPSYFSHFPRFAGTAAAIHAHVITVLLWFALLITQALLARRGDLDTHRRVGTLSFVLVPVMFVGILLAVDAGQLRAKNPDLVLATAFDAGLFGCFFALGIHHRHRPDYHARYMILAAVPFLNPALGRLLSPMISLPLELLIIVGLLVRERIKRGTPRPYAVGLAVFVLGFAGLVTTMMVFPSLAEQLWQLVWGS
jgi:hypothetical protein